MNWMDNAEQEIMYALENGEMTQKEADEAMRDLVAEARLNAEVAADEAYNEAMGMYQ